MAADKLELQVAYLREHPEAGCVLGRQELMLERGIERPGWALIASEVARRRPTLQSLGRWGSAHHHVMRAQLFAEVGSFDPTFLHGGTPTASCVPGQRAPVPTLDDVVLRRRIHNDNHSHDVQALRHSTFRVLRDHVRRRVGRTEIVFGYLDELASG